MSDRCQLQESVDRMEPLEAIAATVSRRVKRLFEDSVVGGQRQKAMKKVTRMYRQVVDRAELRMKRMKLKASGEFDEVQREMRQELYFQYVAHQVSSCVCGLHW